MVAKNKQNSGKLAHGVPTDKSTATFVRLEYVVGTSEKFYEIHYKKSQHTKKIEVITSHGRIGGNPSYQTKYEGKDFEEAHRIWSKFFNQKIKKGYIVHSSLRGTKARSKISGKPTKSVSTVKKARTKASKKKQLEKVRKHRFGNIEL